ncbi:DMT family transporter [Robertkochia sediminum]|uniref:DMT family transporter n=1 Tax=Robertkochia sediminum TaxID=2785326 RepID=UPI001932F0E9|nr:DMT family transporter [Robertkochia sediminum]MBL7473775.1 EamA family transporter [Robertkochia sediminum]
MQETENKGLWPYLQLNFAVLCISSSGVLGRYIQLDPELTIWYRALLATLVIGGFSWFKGYSFKIDNKKDRWIVVLGGLFFGIHWVTYFYALQYSSVAIGMLSIYTYPVLTSMLEPLILKTPFKKIHLLLGAMVLGGIWLLVPEFDLENKFFIAILFGLCSALFYALRNIILKPQVKKYNGSVLMTWQLAVMAIALFPVAGKASVTTFTENFYPILALAVITTSIGHTLLLMTFRYFSVTAASIMSSVQPVYGILLGMLFLGEIPGGNTILGGAVIILAVVAESFISRRRKGG